LTVGTMQLHLPSIFIMELIIVILFLVWFETFYPLHVWWRMVIHLRVKTMVVWSLRIIFYGLCIYCESLICFKSWWLTYL
jgi:hypothetical protein